MNIIVYFQEFTDLVNTHGDEDDRYMADIASVIDELRNLMCVVIQRLIQIQIINECNRCIQPHISEIRHTCLDKVDHTVFNEQFLQASARFTDELVTIIYAANEKTTPTVEVSTVMAIYETEIRKNVKDGSYKNNHANKLFKKFLDFSEPFF